LSSWLAASGLAGFCRFLSMWKNELTQKATHLRGFLLYRLAVRGGLSIWLDGAPLRDGDRR
jgi:hypothetical protein